MESWREEEEEEQTGEDETKKGRRMKTQAVSTWRERTGHGIVTRTREAGMDRRWAEEKEEKKRKEKEKRKTTTQRTTARFKPRSTTAPVCAARMLSRSLAKINRTSVREMGPATD